MTERATSADQIFMDVLLEHVHGGEGVVHERRVEAALARLHREHWAGASPVPSRAGQRLRPWAVLSAAAAALLLAATFLSTGSSALATAAVERSIVAMSAAVDHHYAITVRAPDGPPEESFNGDLYVRGTNVLAVRTDRYGAPLWAGEDERESWVVPGYPWLPVLTGPRGAVAKRVFLREETSLPVLRLTTALRHLTDSYTTTARDVGDGVQEVRARRDRTAEETELPDEVVFRADSAGIIRRLEMRWTSDSRRGLRTATMEHVDSIPRPDAFYGHAAHHEGRLVIPRDERR